MLVFRGLCGVTLTWICCAQSFGEKNVFCDCMLSCQFWPIPQDQPQCQLLQKTIHHMAPQSRQVELALLLNMQHHALQLGSWAQHLPCDSLLIHYFERVGQICSWCCLLYLCKVTRGSPWQTGIWEPCWFKYRLSNANWSLSTLVDSQ